MIKRFLISSFLALSLIIPTQGFSADGDRVIQGVPVDGTIKIGTTASHTTIEQPGVDITVTNSATDGSITLTPNGTGSIFAGSINLTTDVPINTAKISYVSPVTYDKTTSATLTSTELSGLNIITNDGASAEVIMSWPSMTTGQAITFYVNDAQYLRIKAPPAPAYTAKSVILDFADNHGDLLAMGIRRVEFKLAGVLVDLTSGDMTCYATTYQSDVPENAFITGESKVNGAPEWQSSQAVASTTNQRLIAVFNSTINFDEIVVNNSHNYGTNTDRGVQNTKIYYSTDAITSVVYGEAIANSTLLYDDAIREHSALNEIDDDVVVAATGATIRIGPLETTGGGYIRSNVVGNWIKIKSMSDSLVVSSMLGTWTYDE